MAEPVMQAPKQEGWLDWLRSGAKRQHEANLQESQLYRNAFPQEGKPMRFDRDGRTEPAKERGGPPLSRKDVQDLESYGQMGGVVIGPASKFAQIMAPRQWKKLDDLRDIYDMRWRNLQPGERGRAQGDVFEHTDKATGAKRLTVGGGWAEFNPWTILGNWWEGPPSVKDPTRTFPGAQGTVPHELSHLWLARTYPELRARAGLAPQDMVTRLEKQVPGSTQWPLNDPAHNVVYELARRVEAKHPKPSQELALRELEKGTHGLPIPQWLFSAFTQHNPQAFAGRGEITDWLMQRARTPGSKSVHVKP